MTILQAEQHIAALDQERVQRYERYFDTLVPLTDYDRFRRWLFAYASVHTGWESNCRLYQLLAPLDWLANERLLRQRVVESRAGLHNNRTRYIMQFAEYFWKHPSWFQRMPDEPWFDCRERLMTQALGLGPAKTAFALELTNFQHAGVACFDTHMVQLYGYSARDYSQGRVSGKAILQLERHWTDTCYVHGVSPVTARWIWWDKKQKKTDSRYWSYVLEPEGYVHA